MFNKNLAMAVKVEGKVLREIDGKVYLPFGCEYTLYFKNTSHRRVKIKVTIDGQDAMDGRKLIVNAHSNAELKRFMKNGNLNEGNSFKFIEKTAQISKHRGDRVDDGLITVEYEFEKEAAATITTTWPYRTPKEWVNSGMAHTQETDNYRRLLPNAYPVADFSVHDGAMMAQTAMLNSVVPKNTAGITAPGSQNSQQFNTTSWYGSDVHSKSSMTIELKGEAETDDIAYDIDGSGSVTISTNGNVHIKADSITVPVTIKTKVQCTMCGNEYKAGTKFCSECGTSLRIY